MADPKIRLGIETQGAQNLSSLLKQEAEALARAMVRSARETSASSRQVQADIKAEIDLLKQKNQEEEKLHSLELRKQRLTGRVTPEQYRTRREQLSTKREEGDLLVQYAKDIFERLKTTSEKEIASDRRNVEKQIRDSRTVRELDPEGDEFKIFKETVQAGTVDKLKEEEEKKRKREEEKRDREKNRQEDLDERRRLTQITQGIGVAQAFREGNVGGIIGSGANILAVSGGKIAGRAGIVGLIVNAVYDLFTGATREIEQNVRGYAVATQTPLSDVRRRAAEIAGPGVTELGFTPSEFIMRREQILRAAGGEFQTNDLGLVSAEISRGLRPNQVERLVSQGRYGGQQNPLLTIASFENFLKDSSRSMVQLPEIMETYLRRADSILQRTGVINTTGLQQTIQGIAQTYNVSGANLDRFSSAFEQGFGQSQNPVIQALQFQTLSQVYPERGLWDYKKIMQDPLSHPRYIRAMLENIKTLSRGDKEFEKFGLSAFLPRLGAVDIEKIVEGGEFKIPKPSPARDKRLLEDYPAQAEKFTSAIESFEKDVKSNFEKALVFLEDVWTATENINEKMGRFLKFFHFGGYYEESIRKAVYEGSKQAAKETSNMGKNRN